MIDHDHTKYAYHEGTRKLRAIADWISETTYTGAGPETGWPRGGVRHVDRAPSTALQRHPVPAARG